MVTRRQFLETSLLGSAAVVAGPVGWTAFGEEKRRASANDTIRAAVIGCGIRGKQQVQVLLSISGCEVASVCDPDADRVGQLAEAVRERQRRGAKAVQDMRRVFDDKSVDAVFIATCNHWHALSAIWAMQSGKDVYVEKPISHNIWEGRRIVEVARKLGRICQGGTQNRSNNAVAAAVEYMRQGKLGQVKLARSIIYGRRGSIGGPGKYDVPATVDYNLWAGPAPMSPLTRPNFHYDWHWFWETGNGELGNNNIHPVDICRWGLGLTGMGRAAISYGGRLGYRDAGETPNTQVCIHDFGDKTIVQETRGLKSPPFSKTLKGMWIFYGTEGIIANTSLFDGDGTFIRAFEGGSENHFANFLDAVRTRKQDSLRAEILEGHQSTALCHAANISYRLGRPASPAEVRRQLESMNMREEALETFERTYMHLLDNEVDLDRTPLTLGAALRIDPDHEAFLGNDQANALLTRDYRKPFVVPSASEA